MGSLYSPKKIFSSLGANQRSPQVARSTYYRWKRLFGGMSPTQIVYWVSLHNRLLQLQRKFRNQQIQIRILQQAFQLLPVTVALRRCLVQDLQHRMNVSQRLACDTLNQSRSSQNYSPTSSSAQNQLRERMCLLASENPRYGYRRITSLLRRQGWRVSRKRIHRLWKQQRLQVRPRRKKRRPPLHANSGHKALAPTEVWAWDFIDGEDRFGCRLRWLSIIDEFTRQSVALEVSRHFTPEKVTRSLGRALVEHGLPQFIRSDNELLWRAPVLRDWLAERSIRSLYILPRSPWLNCYVESFHSRMRDELIEAHDFQTLAEARIWTSYWRRHYNQRRPHSSLNYMTPDEFEQSRGRNS